MISNIKFESKTVLLYFGPKFSPYKRLFCQKTSPRSLQKTQLPPIPSLNTLKSHFQQISVQKLHSIYNLQFKTHFMVFIRRSPTATSRISNCLTQTRSLHTNEIFEFSRVSFSDQSKAKENSPNYSGAHLN